jgi:hypothetical protein
MTQGHEDDGRGGYRDGFVNGARAIFEAIGDDLPEEQMRVLQKWIDGPLDAWRREGPDTSPPPVPMIDGA